MSRAARNGPDARFRRGRWVALGVLAFLVAAVIIPELALQTSYAPRLYPEVRRRPPHPFLQVLPAGQVDHVNSEGFRGEPVGPGGAGGDIPNRPRSAGRQRWESPTPTRTATHFCCSRCSSHGILARGSGSADAGAAGYLSAHDLVAYQVKVRRFKPNLVIFFEALNDLTRSFSPPWFALGELQARLLPLPWTVIGLAGPEVQIHRSPVALADVEATSARRSVRSQTRAAIATRITPRMTSLMRPIDNPAFRSLSSFRGASMR